MFERSRAQGWVLILAVALATGCRMGVPLDRNVQISQQFSDEKSQDAAPKTRLAPSGVGRRNAANAERDSKRLAQRPPVDQSTNFSISDADSGADSAAPVDMQFSDAELSPDKLSPDKGLGELLADLRDSPPEVQQQVLGQLANVVAHVESTVDRTDQPMDIRDQLSRALRSLPALPEAPEGSEAVGKTPIRLASSEPGRPNASGVPAVARAIATAVDGDPAVSNSVAATSANKTADSKSVSESTVAAALESPEQSPVRSPASGTPAELFAQLIEAFGKPTEGESAADLVRRELVRAHLQVLAGDSEWTVDGIGGLGRREQDFLRNHLVAVGKLVDPDAHPVPARRFALALPEYREAVMNLGATAEHLEIRSAAFCKEIISFGQVKRFGDEPFEAGQKVIVYCEIDNFVADKTDVGYETEIQGSYELFDAEGVKVGGQVLPKDLQQCDHPLRDYFIGYQMHLPARLEPGQYRLELTMECLRGKKYGQVSLPLVIKK